MTKQKIIIIIITRSFATAAAAIIFIVEKHREISLIMYRGGLYIYSLGDRLQGHRGVLLGGGA